MVEMEHVLGPGQRVAILRSAVAHSGISLIRAKGTRM
jgi:hypothetical protein